MAIDTNDEKLALMEWDQVWEPGLPLDEASGFDQGDRQQLLWGYPGVLWLAAATIDYPNRGLLLGVYN